MRCFKTSQLESKMKALHVEVNLGSNINEVVFNIPPITRIGTLPSDEVLWTLIVHVCRWGS